MELLIGVVFSILAVTSAMYTPSDDVVELTAANFDKLVKNGDELWIVEFYAPWCGHCKSLAPEYKKAATALKGIAKLGAVDSTVHNTLGGQYGVQGFPTIKIFGLDKANPKAYQAARTAQSLVDTVMGEIKSMATARMSGGGSSGGGSKSSGGGGGGGGSGGGSKGGSKVVTLTDSNFKDLVLDSEDLWLVEFYAPWCGHCKNLAPHWESAASELDGKVKLGALDATENSVTAGRYGVRGYPTIKMFPSGSKDGGEAQEYDGGRTSGDIVNWALEKVAENIPAPEVVQLTEPESLTNACEGRQLCIIAILPHILDCQSECRNKFLSILIKMGEKYKKRMWGYTWAEAGSQTQVEEAFGMGGFGYPAMAALNSRKMKFSQFKGSFSEEGINEFLRELGFGRGSTEALRGSEVPKVEKIEPWDGKDGEMYVEEDIDLSDVELDDLDDLKDEL